MIEDKKLPTSNLGTFDYDAFELAGGTEAFDLLTVGSNFTSSSWYQFFDSEDTYWFYIDYDKTPMVFEFSKNDIQWVDSTDLSDSLFSATGSVDTATEAEAWSQAQNFARERLSIAILRGELKKPFDYEKSNIRKADDGTFIVEGFIKCWGSIGLPLKIDFSCKLKYVGSGEWKLLSIYDGYYKVTIYK